MADSDRKPHRFADPAGLPPEIGAPLARFNGDRPPAPHWFDKALANRPERSMIEVEGCPIELLTWGEVGKPGLLFLHGNAAHADWWSFIAPFFADDYRVAAMSWSGMGASGWRPHYTGELFAAEALGAAEAAGLYVEGHKPIVIAHSFGGFATRVMAAQHPDRLRAAVYVDSPIRPPESEWRGPPTRSRPNKVYATHAEALARFRLAPPQGCENLYIADFIARHSLHEVEGGWTWKFDPAMWERFDRESMGDSHAAFGAARVPVAALWGGRSNLIPSEVEDYMRRMAPPGTPMIPIPDSDHHVMIDQPLALVAALRALLETWPITPHP
ncbi:pimeloyl-ACP methyl ester carboxylesterase [Caulobacter ginsengisoli]|uniref:Pimeloyl-ACP methyl ester carboxylesterase n=1 Tax=Caulobacter ginsengisoli TaxID=400775 RepID=A0ABU0IUK5_9CAUL|nr:alpha/beta hydrolase [Caulobacter ginsengisoli]MDQ0465060.1 pimeloyl-ACP methyl ester carboxylesterase [Caulobacter ginsengisoli]